MEICHCTVPPWRHFDGCPFAWLSAGCERAHSLGLQQYCICCCITQRHAADELSDQLMSGKSLLTCTKFWPGQAFTEVAAAMLGTLTGSLGVAAHDVHGNRALLDTSASAHRLHSKLRPKTEVLWRTAGSNAAQRDMCSVTTMLGGAQGNRADALGVSGSASSRRGHSTAASSSGSNSSSGTSRATSLEAASNVSDLRSVPGVGPKNEQLLVASGHASLGALQHHFSKGVRGDTVAMSEYLRVSFYTQLVCLCLTPPGRSDRLLLSRSLSASSYALMYLYPLITEVPVCAAVRRGHPSQAPLQYDCTAPAAPAAGCG